MGLFQHIEGESVVLVENGVYKQVDLFKRDGVLFAQSSGGFIKLMYDGATTKPKVRIDALVYDGPLYRDQMGRLLCDGDLPGAKPLESNTQQKLLGIAGPTE